jgi:5'-3' exonuclease
MNHPTRTFFFHVLHLMRAGVQLVFVHDGLKKPAVKRGSRVNYPNTYVPYEPSPSSLRSDEEIAKEYTPAHITYLVKQILELLSIPWLDAQGEAEAECAQMEEAGVVDAVLTKDADAFLFGARLVIKFLMVQISSRFTPGETPFVLIDSPGAEPEVGTGLFFTEMTLKTRLPKSAHFGWKTWRNQLRP